MNHIFYRCAARVTDIFTLIPAPTQHLGFIPIRKNNVQINEIILSKEQLLRVNVNDVIERFDKKTNDDYSAQFNQLAEQAKNEGNNEDSLVWLLLTGITSMHLCASNAQKPFSPFFVMADCRSTIPEDISDKSLDALSEWLPEILDVEFKARIADLLWIRRRKPDFAHIAINAYLESAKLLEDETHWVDYEERIERSLRLANLFRRKTPEYFDSITKHIEEILDKYAGADCMFLSLKLLELMAEFKAGDPNKYLGLSTDIAKKAKSTFNWHKAEYAWDIAEKWAILLKDENQRNAIITQKAETYAAQAQSADGGLISCTWMQKAIELYKRVPDSKNRRDELYQLLRRYQEKTLDQMHPFKGPKMDLTESVEASRKTVSGKTFENSLFHLAFSVANIPNYEEVKQQAKDQMKKYFLQHLFGAMHIDRDGLIVATVPSGLDLDNDEQGKVIWAQMLRTVEIHHNIDVQGAIDPAIREINLEHNCTEEKIYNLISDNPFIPNGFEYLYAKGLHAGLIGDFIVATHLLIPQIENCLRYILQENGVETTTLNTHGLQERIRIEAILKHPKLSEIIGKDMVLDFQTLLIERKYSNLRNEVSHGLMQWNYFYQPNVVYFWWLSLRFCLLPFIGK